MNDLIKELHDLGKELVSLTETVPTEEPEHTLHMFKVGKVLVRIVHLAEGI